MAGRLGSRRAALVTSFALVVLVGALAQPSSGSHGGFDESLSFAPRPRKELKLDARLASVTRRAVSVEIRARRPAAARALVKRLGGRVHISYGRLVEATVPSARLGTRRRAQIEPRR